MILQQAEAREGEGLVADNAKVLFYREAYSSLLVHPSFGDQNIMLA